MGILATSLQASPLTVTPVTVTLFGRPNTVTVSGEACNFNRNFRLGCITENYLCAPEANVYGIDFTRFKIRDMGTNATLFEISKPPGAEIAAGAAADGETDPNVGRFVRYQFTPQFLKLRTVGATVEFTVGTKPVKNFRCERQTQREAEFQNDHSVLHILDR